MPLIVVIAESFVKFMTSSPMFTAVSGSVRPGVRGAAVELWLEYEEKTSTESAREI